jgi:hypothetical protein
MLELPTVRYATTEELDAGKCCQSCDQWMRYKGSYAYGVCTVGGVSVAPRWTSEVQFCEGFERAVER